MVDRETRDAPAPPVGLLEWNDVISQGFVPLTARTQSASDARDFRGTLSSVAYRSVQVSDVSGRRVTVERSVASIARSDPRAVKLSLQLRGMGRVDQGARTATLFPGDLVIYDTSEPYTLAFDEPFAMRVAMVPRALIAFPQAEIGQLTALRISGRSMPARLLTHMMAEMSRSGLMGGASIRMVESAFVELVGAVLAELPSPARTASSHAIFSSARRLIDQRLGEEELDTTSVALALHVSPRHLQKAFQRHGTTVAAWIRARRLERCARELTDPLLADEPVSAIRSRFGFHDASHFARTFKAQFGMSPREFRRHHGAAITEVVIGDRRAV
ncbi:AraC family transcriptional regulator [Prauserella sp. PE36]|uniref:Helix-turn-helix domain-containing protein n=1 Tax=Prauserella endophytica TaxID=1592324 RepID=A0ABY2S497_9PSEU|nr:MULTISPECIES: helix-turn-helix domain-containing protein [Prauserella]PXY23261.1 hypothetical protein BAY59_26605 [Prauserella coralliicola]RBM18857.1 AraC family transcriptional regulator [Prauserella sp. PE36]TKG70620.1 helix-turn-helix domain-containing protein [Prauserella endophytica]